MIQIKETKIVRSHRKSLAMTITSDATLIVKAPKYIPNYFINSFIKNHDEWIQKQLHKLEKKPRITMKRYDNNEIFLFLGMNLRLEYSEAQEITVTSEKLLFPMALKFRVQKQLLAWYKKQSRDIITRQLDFYASQMQTSYTGLTFSDTKSQWGSCNRENRLQFSWRLVMAPITVINYVVIHELAHTLEKNHSREFWSIVQKYCPSYQRQRKWLKENGNTLVI